MSWDERQLEEVLGWRVVPDRLRHWARTDPDRRFFRCGGDWFSFGAADRATDAIGGALAERGIDKGDRVAIMLPNHEDYVLAVLALAKLGAIQVPVNPFLKGEFLRHQLSDSGASALISDHAGLAAAARIRDQLPDLRLLVSVGPTELDGTVPFSELRDSGLSCPDNHITARDTPSELGEDELKAWIVPAGSGPDAVSFDPAELHEFLAAELPYVAVPRYVQFTEALPVNAPGRVQKFRLRESDNADAWDFAALGLVIRKDRRR